MLDQRQRRLPRQSRRAPPPPAAARPPRATHPTRPAASPRLPPSPCQIWILLAVATLSALPWSVVEFRKAGYSVHYQGAAASTPARRPLPPPLTAGQPLASARPPRRSMVRRRHLCDPGGVGVHLRGTQPQRAWGSGARVSAGAAAAAVPQQLRRAPAARCPPPPGQVAMHLEFYNRPRLQLRVVRILWMVRRRVQAAAGAGGGLRQQAVAVAERPAGAAEF